MKAILHVFTLLLVFTFSAQAQQWAYNSLTNVNYTTGGSVGIGTQTPATWFPSKTLEIYDTRPVLKLTSTNSTGFSTIVFTNTAVPGGNAHTGEFHLNHQFNASDNSKSLLRFNSYPANEIMSLRADGNVGIGTTTPDSKLTVDGRVKCEEVAVEVIQGTGPDYVFEKDYNLLPLAELEAYINQNKHLPEVPSAKEMEANGLNLREMNLLLLKKVEELTLHMIEQKKEITSLQNEIETLKRK